MNKKIKILLICLGIISLAGASLTAWIYLSAQTEITKYAEREAELEKQNTHIQERLDVSQQESRHWQEKSESITAALNKLSKEHTHLQGQYDSLVKEKDSLAEENKNINAELERINKLYAQAQEETKKPKIDTSDKFLSSLLKEKATLGVEVEKLKKKISSQKVHLEEIERQVRPSEKKIESLQKEMQGLEEEWQKAQKVTDLLSSDLLQEKKKRTSLEGELAKTEGQLRDIMQERDKLADQLTKMRQALEQRLAELNRTKKILQSAVEGAKEAARKTEAASIQLPPIVVRAEQEAPSRPTEISKAEVTGVTEETLELAGRVITVNDKYRFVVIDIGRNDGVEKEMSFNVYRKGKRVGKVEVIETRKNIAACDIKELSVKRLEVNDIVRQ